MGTFDDKTKNYYLTYNATIYLFDMCRYLRKSVYSSIAIDYLASAIVTYIKIIIQYIIILIIKIYENIGKFRG